MKSQKHLLLAIILLGSALVLNLPATSLEKEEEHLIPWSSGGTVVVKNSNGAISITGWSRAEVKVRAIKKIQAGSAREAEKIAQQIGVEIQPQDNVLYIRTSGLPEFSRNFLDWLLGTARNASVQYQIFVPEETHLQVSTSNGRITLKNVSGIHRLKTSNGRIEGKQLRGAVHAKTSNGRISLHFSQVDASSSIELETSNGRIELQLPDESSFHLFAKTSNGKIDCEFPLSEMIQQDSPNHLEGKSGQGGLQVVLRTSNGSIYVKKSTALVEGGQVENVLQIGKEKLHRWLNVLRSYLRPDSLRPWLRELIDYMTYQTARQLLARSAF